ncbi:unnamed protein product [Peronospora belbahrii]|uniref:Calmodulin n=1 Tax=Peronospora belbahrii TaxID=622444 RepID=A0AAU9KYR7_9STRA|nr:unnamed protein product [Peronospora belbahrii]
MNMEMYTTQSSMNHDTPLNLWVPISHQEVQYYNHLFTYVDTQHVHTIKGHQAVGFFTRSYLDKTVLREIWNVADSQHRSELSRNEFYAAMRLISMAQHGEPVTLKRFYELAATQYPLARIDGIPLPRERHQMTTQVAMQTSTHARLHTPQRDCRALHSQQPLSSGTMYGLTIEDKHKYDAIFQQYDTDQDGFLMGPEAVALFQLSGLDRNILRDIWSMADVTQDSKLSIQEFYVAMHLIVCLSKRGLPMPPTFPRELKEAAFGAGGNAPFVSSPGYGSHVTASPSHNGLTRPQQDSVPPPKPQGMSAFDSLPTVKDAPLLNLTSSTPRSLHDSTFAHTDNNAKNSQLNDSSEPSVLTPAGSLHMESSAPAEQHDVNSFPTSRTPSVVGRDRTKSASSLSSMSSFNGLAPLPTQQPTRQFPLQMQSDTLGFQTYSPLGGMGSGGPQPSVASSKKPFMCDEEEKTLVGKLDQQNRKIVEAIAGVEDKQSSVEIVLEKLRDLDELRHELVTLVMKRDNMRAASAFTCKLSDSSAEHTAHAIERSLRSLVENQKQLVCQLQRDISRYESELEEAILSATLQQKLSLESQSSLIDAATPPVSDSSRDAGGGTTAFTGTHIILDGSNALSSSVAVPGSPSISAFSPDATDSSEFDAFSNFDSAPRSFASATPSPAGAVTFPSASSSQSASGSNTFNAFGSFVAPLSAGVAPSALPNVGNTMETSPFDATFSSAAMSDSIEFDDFTAAVPHFAADTGMAPAIPAAVDATSPFSTITPSPLPTVIDDRGFSDLDGFQTFLSPLPDAAAKFSSAVVASNSSTDFSSNLIPSEVAAPIVPSTPASESSPFLPTPSSAVTEMPVLDVFATTLASNDGSSTLATADVANENLILSPVAPGDKELNVFGDSGDATAMSTDNAAISSDLASKQESFGNLLFSATPSPVAATEVTSLDTFGDFCAPPTSRGSVMSVHASETATMHSPIALAAVDGDDFTSFGDFSAAPASADSAASLVMSNEVVETTSKSVFSPVAEDDTESDFGEFSAAPSLSDTAATPSESSEMIDPNGSSTVLLVAPDSSKSDDFSKFDSASVKVDSLKCADVLAISPFSPVSGETEVIEDCNATPTLVKSVKPVATTDTIDTNDVSVLEDMSTSDGFESFNQLN